MKILEQYGIPMVHQLRYSQVGPFMTPSYMQILQCYSPHFNRSYELGNKTYHNSEVL